MKKTYIRQARLPKEVYDQNLDLKEILGQIKAKKGDEKNMFKHFPSCRCKSCFTYENNR